MSGAQVRRAAVLVLALAGALAVSATPRRAHAESCPDEAPANGKERRALAGRWFAKGQEAVRDGDAARAVAAFACSLHVVPHAFTAFNLGVAAEEAGDLQQAVEALRTYEALASENAPDRADVRIRLERLERKLKSLVPSSPVVSPRPPPKLTPATSPAPTTSPRPNGAASRTAGWLFAATGVAVAGAGLYFNVAARSELDRSRELLRTGGVKDAGAAWDRARRHTRMSYAGLAIGGAAMLAGGAMLLLNRPEAAAPAEVALWPGGAVVSLRFVR